MLLMIRKRIWNSLKNSFSIKNLVKNFKLDYNEILRIKQMLINLRLIKYYYYY